MHKVYESSTAHEAHLVKILLESKGIRPRIDGEHLPSGAGTLPAIGLVRVMVEDQDYIAASEFIDDWESDRTAASDKGRPKQKPKALVGFIVGASIASVVFLWIYNTPVTEVP